MPTREDVISSNVTNSILHSDKRLALLWRLPAFFYVYWLPFGCVREDLFKALRGVWNIQEEDYRRSFGAEDGGKHALKPMGDMGYSGSTFFSTADGAFLVKSIPRYFENSFFKNDLLLPYADYMRNNPGSLLVQITDFLASTQPSIGTILGFAPSHHIVMENILKCKEQAETVWETYDLKPQSYFYPERDIAEGVLTSEATKSKLADDFNEKLILSLNVAEAFKGQLEKDTALLSKCNAVDYSLFLVRIPIPESGDAPTSNPSSWRHGVKSADGKFLYRAAVLDFFWAKHKVHAMAMTGLIIAYNTVDKQGPMSVTTNSPEYRKRFLKMVFALIETR